MKIRVNSSQFADVLNWVARTVPARPSILALGGVLVETINGRLLLTGSDGDTTAKQRVDVTEIIEEGKFLVPARQFADIVRSLSQGDLTLTLEESRVKIECAGGRYGVPTLPVEDYPTYSDLPGSTGKLHGETFSRAALQVAVAAAPKDAVPASLTSVMLSAQGSLLTLVATDKYRMAIREIPWSPADADSTESVMVPKSALVDVAKSFAGSGEITLALTPQEGETTSKVGFGVKDASLSTLQVTGDYPKFRGLMPTDFSATAVVPVDRLTEVIRRVSLVLRPDAPIKLTFSDNSILVEGGNQTGDDADGREAVSCDYTGEAISIAFNPGYLLDGIGAAGTEEILFSLQNSTKPAVIASNDEKQSFRYLIMPVRLTS